MKILHIGDIHLGCMLENRKRNGEIEKVFRHLAGYVRDNDIEAALIAGDVFDRGTPSNESQELYYHFLLELQQAGCRQAVIIAGNHDSASFLEAPQALLKQMNIHIIGTVSPDDPEKEVIALGREEAPAAYVCAVPFLNERDVRLISPEGESAVDRDAAVCRGIEKHYRDVFQIADKKRNGRKIPIIGMGHLYAAGSTFAASGDAITPVGSLNPVDLNLFAGGYDYMALGHLHKPQIVKKHENWRYAGSILPMNLREYDYAPQVILLDSRELGHPLIHELPADCFHEMKVISGTMTELREQLSELDGTGRDIWVKVIYEDPEIRPNWAIELRQEFRERKIQIVLSEERKNSVAELQNAESRNLEKSLASMTPEELFLKHLDRKGEVTDPEQRETCLKLFRQSMFKVYDPSVQKEKPDVPAGRGVMKFERLYLKNVNSLYGENLIDFTAPEFNDGIFLISGNTGAGKSSILDAICLALFGATPRASVSSQKDCIMSEGTNEIQAELTFSLGGSRYRACFQHQRTIRAHNPFAAVQHRLYKDDVQVPGSATEVKEKIAGLIGMDRVQFCRCILLAQGSFDSFLKAKGDERSSILKSITGTEIYSEIGRQINADFSEVRSRYELAKQALEGVNLLTAEEKQELQERKEQLVGEMRRCCVELKDKEGVEIVFQAVEQAKIELQKASEMVAAAERSRAETAMRRKELDDANRAMNCEKNFLQVQNIRRQQQELLKMQTELHRQQQQLEKSVAELEKKRAGRDRELAGLEERQKISGALFQAVRQLDQQIANLHDQYDAAEKELVGAKGLWEKNKKEFQEAEQRWNAARQKADEAERYCRAYADDQKLPQQKNTWELRRTQIIAEEKRNADDQRKLELLRSAAAGKKRESLRNEQKLLAADEKRKEILRSLENSRQRMDSLLLGKNCQELRESWAAAVKLDELFKDSVQRQEYLSPGNPCPLCGSVTHPYCEGTPVPDGRDFSTAAKALERKIAEIDNCQSEIRKTELEKEKNQAEITSLQERIAELHAALPAEEKTVREQAQILDGHCRETSEKAAALTAELQNMLHVSWPDHSAALPEELERRIDRFETMHRILESLAAEKEKYDKARAVHTVVNPQSEALVRQKEKLHSDLAARLTALEAERYGKFENKCVDEEEKKLADAVESCRKERELTTSEAIRNQTQLTRNQEDLRKSAGQQEELAAGLKRAETEFSALLLQNDFPSEADFTSRRREPQYIHQLTAEIQRIDDALNTGRGALAERRKILEDTLAKLPENLKREDNLQQLRQLQERSRKLQDDFNAATLKWDQNEAAGEKFEQDGRKVAALALEFNHWKYLDDNFGSASADRFGRIAQGYTFSELLHFANNNRLRSLRRHFTLVSDIEDPLELNVIDHLRGGAVRTSRNLSGGEGFEVSLALALGLAEMSSISQNASLGNVLLDEGFGTLDDDSLESALELLMQLRRTDQKLVGIISHVSKLKERIAAQIEVTNSGGMGSLSGAGVIGLPQAAGKTEKRGGRSKRKNQQHSS